MRTGRLSISRGSAFGASESAPVLRVVDNESPPEASAPDLEAPPLPQTARAPLTPPPLPAADPHLVQHRLDALERLSRLYGQGALSDEEFNAEKGLVLRLPCEELLLDTPIVPFVPLRAEARPRPSLLGRLFGWRLLLLSLVIGLAVSAWVQPRETVALFNQAMRLIGA